MKKIISLLSAVCIMVMLIFPVLAFTDVSNNSWYSTAVDFCASRGYVTGYKDGTFKPNNTVTRAELAVIMNNKLGLKSTATNNFKDVPSGKWYTKPILNCVKAGIITGYSSTQFGPNDRVTREQAAVILANAFDISKKNGRSTFADDGQISAWAVGSVIAMAAEGLIAGVGNNRFAPKANITRGAICQIIYSAENLAPAPNNDINNMIVPMYVRQTDIVPSMEDFWTWIQTYAVYLARYDTSSVDLSSSWGAALTKQQVKDAAYAIIPDFDGIIPEMPASDTWKQENGLFYFRIATPEATTMTIKSVSEQSDGTVNVISCVHFEVYSDVEDYYYKYTMRPNAHVNPNAKTPYHYTIIKTEGLSI